VSIVVVARDPSIIEPIASGLARANHRCEVCADSREASTRLAAGDVLAVILDLDVAELGIVDMMRAHRRLAPVIALANETNVAMCVNALDRGVDVYLRKPFDADELLARFRALIRRSAAPRWAPLSFNHVTLLPEQSVEVGRALVQLSPIEYAILELLLRGQSETVFRSALLTTLRSSTGEVSRILNVHIANLRAKLGTQLVEIECVRSIGYRLLAVGHVSARAGVDAQRSLSWSVAGSRAASPATHGAEY
jgi:DNA-binding response OmpR family regulator